MGELSGPQLRAVVCRTVALAHAGQLDGIGAPYSGHLDRVAARAESIRARYHPDLDPVEVYCVAVAHDLLEDTHVNAADLLEVGVPARLCQTLEMLTHAPGQPRAAYLEHLVKDRLAALVKLADTLDNADPVRLDKVADLARRTRLEEKYAKAIPVLEAVVYAPALRIPVTSRREVRGLALS